MEENRLTYGKITSLMGIGCNIFLAVSKLIIGLMSGMISIVADAVNNFSDATASIVSLVGFKLSSMPADDEHPFGHARYEYISGLVVAFLVMLAGVELLKSSIQKIINPTEIKFSFALFLVLIISIFVKLLMSVIYKKIGRKINSTVILAAGQDSRNDMISTSAVLISSWVSYRKGINLDGIIGTVVALFVLYSGIELVKDTIKPLLGTTPDEELVKKIESKIMSYEGVLGTHDLMVHDYGPGHCFASVHVEVPAERNVLECHELIDTIEMEVQRDMQIELVIHYDPIVTSDKMVGSVRLYLKEQAKNIYEQLSIHDLRIVPGENNTNVIFDCLIPASCPLEEKDILKELKERLKKEYPDYTAVIKVDHSYVSLKK